MVDDGRFQEFAKYIVTDHIPTYMTIDRSYVGLVTIITHLRRFFLCVRPKSHLATNTRSYFLQLLF